MSDSAAAGTDVVGRHGVAADVPHGGRAYVAGVDGFTVTSETVGQALMRLADEAAERPAVMWTTDRGAAELTWLELCDRARRGAAILFELNPRRERVAIAALNSVEWIVAMFACAFAGMPIVPISASGSDDETRHQLDHARVGVVLAARSAGNYRVLDRMNALAASLERPLVVRDIADLGSTVLASPTAVSPTDELLVQFTSGTTGRPKAASLSHRAALSCGAVFMRAVGCSEGDRFLNPLPLHHVGGSVTGLIAVLAIGGAYILVERFSPQAVLDALRQTRPSIAGLVPTMMIDLLALPDVTPADFASLRTVIGGAAAVDPALIAQMEHRLGITMIGSYGQSEAPAMTASSREDSPTVRTQTLGRCLAGRDFAIRDRAGAITALGEIGELCVRGPLTMSGYLRPEGGVDPAVDAEGWRPTGDLCSMDHNGVISFHGRIREVVIRGGLNVYPAEVEQAISTHESVSEVAVFGIADKRLGERVVAAVIPTGGGAVDVDQLTALAAERLSSYKRPAEWLVVTSLPRTSTGKVRKHLLREWYENGTLEANCAATPAG
ncbi:class I adenylate-forming enzyme family protein [Mycobacterium sp.]|uniref:class I adenylate-forming enzyme family protein n=1 Tax=Mycobacterium sp. TaxID=1785 RepID=UPI00121E61C0|nr:class I adenylate-forming enzyme family protein [Mycobacterium sp.]TAM65173.1 MAG: long-chain fatty acid--CoA ligase [Mycobacterium sp.]